MLAQRNGEWRYLEFLQVTSLIMADIFMREAGADQVSPKGAMGLGRGPGSFPSGR